MTPADFNRWPALLTRSQVLEVLGISKRTLCTLRIPLTSRQQAVPFGKIGALRGWHPSQQQPLSGPVHWHYRKSDVAVIVGPPYDTTHDYPV